MKNRPKAQLCLEIKAETSLALSEQHSGSFPFLVFISLLHPHVLSLPHLLSRGTWPNTGEYVKESVKFVRLEVFIRHVFTALWSSLTAREYIEDIRAKQLVRVWCEQSVFTPSVKTLFSVNAGLSEVFSEELQPHLLHDDLCRS